MKPRKLIPLSLLILILLFTFVALSFSQVRQQYIRDFSYLTADLRHMQQKIDDFIDDFKKGDLKAFRYITYDVLERSVLQVKDEAVRNRQQIIEMYDKKKNELSTTIRNGNAVPFMEYLIAVGGSNRDKLVRCSLQGLFNMDPRVRLTAVHFLRKLLPDASMQRMVKMAVGIDSEWISYDRAKKDFVFTPPQRLETVSSRWEYYREKDINWPTDVLPGAWGLNDHVHQALNDNNVVGDLNSARWGETLPVAQAEEFKNLNLGAGRPEVNSRGYNGVGRPEVRRFERMSDDQKKEYMSKVRQGQIWVNNADGTGGDWKPITYGYNTVDGKFHEDKFESSIPFLGEESYRRYHTQESRWGGTVDLLSYQSDQIGQFVPMGQGARYTYVNCDGYRVVANPYAETMKLDEFITRVIWWKKIKNNQMNSMAIVSKDTFSTLWRSIDGELPQYIPFLSTATANSMLDYNDVDIIVNGMHKNKNLLNKWVMMRSLKDIYKHANCPENIREDINIALWEEKREINKRSYVHGLVLTKESIRVGKLDAVAEHQNEVAALKVATRGTKTIKKEDLGFRLPNSEIRANGYRLITENTTTPTGAAGVEDKVSLNQLHRNRIYAYRDDNNDIIDYYRDKEKFYRLQRQYLGKKEREVFNTERVRDAQALLNALLSGDGESWRVAQWPEVETAVILTMARVMAKYKANPDEKFITTFMDQVRIQEPTAATVTNEDGVAKDFANDSYSDMKRDNIVKASLGGLFNRDPRVRLQCIHFLRRLGPDQDMLAEVIRARSVMATESTQAESPETDDYRSAFIDTNVYERREDALQESKDYKYRGIDEPVAGDTNQITKLIPRTDYTIPGYEYQKYLQSNLERDPSGQRLNIPYYGEYQLKAPSEELEKLYKYCLRDQLVTKIKSGNVETVKEMDRLQFSVLAGIIDDEFILEVPFASFHSEPFGQRTRIRVSELRGNTATTAEIWSEDNGKPDKYAIFEESDIKVIKKGIDSRNFLIQKGTGEFLIRFYNSYPALAVETKREILDSLYFYKQDDIVVEEIYLAFEGQNPDGRAVIKVGTKLAAEMNPGGIRVYNSLPIGIRKDIRDAILNEQEQFPPDLLNIIGVIGKRSPSVEDRDRLDYQARSTGERERVGTVPTQPEGYTSDNARSTTNP